jgi:hypothetical protein
MQGGDVLVVDIPSAESLRLSAHIVRELAGAKLLGICVFRLPTAEDAATLTIAQVAAALADLDSRAEVEVRILPDAQAAPLSRVTPSDWVVEVKNAGTANALIGSVNIDLQAKPGTIESFTTERMSSVEFLCAAAGLTEASSLAPCSQRRANVIRFKPRTLIPGQTVTARLAVNRGFPSVIFVLVEMQTDTGQHYLERREVAVESRAKP